MTAGRGGPEPGVVRLSTRVDPYHDGWRLGDYLEHRFRYLDAETWQRRVASGVIAVNGDRGEAAVVLHRGDLVEYEVHVVEPPVDFSYDVLHDDADILAVSKSGNIPVHAGGTYFTHTLIARLREDFGPGLDLAHRLDRETSGVVVLVRNRRAARELAGAFARGEVVKDYVAVVHGDPATDTFDVDEPIGRVGRDHPVARRVIDREHGRPARTLFRVAARLGRFSVVEAKPLTGRTNQVRVHLEHIGHPIVGDKVYGLPRAMLEEFLRDPASPRVAAHLVLRRHALHAARVKLLHPTSRRPLEIEAPLPTDMARFIERGGEVS